jgi:prophage DNA circulation protein
LSYREQLQPAKFREVPFHVKAAETTVGRRVVVHEFPNKELPLPEDMGKKGSEFVVNGFIIGDDYIDDMKRLIDALTQPGPGTLVHPTLGSLQVVLAHPGQLREQFIEHRGQVTFSLKFVEASDAAQPSTTIDTQQAVEDAADECYEPMEEDFAEEFSIDGAPGWSIESITGEINRINDVLTTVRNALSFDLSSLSTLLRAGNIFKANLIGLLAMPGAFAKELTTLLRGFVGLFDFSSAQARIFGGLGIASKKVSNKATAFREIPFGSTGRVTRPMDVLLALGSYGQAGTPYARPTIPTNTPVRRQQAANQAAVFALFSRTAVVEAVRSSIYIPFDSAEQAIAVRDRLFEALGALMLDASDPVYAALHTLRSAMVVDITARGGDKVRLSRITLQASQPARVLSYRLYGSGDYASEIVARNQAPETVLHPLFMPGGTELGVRRV